MDASIQVVLDAGPLVAWLSDNDQHPELCSSILCRPPLPVVTCESVIAEAAHRPPKFGYGVDGLRLLHDLSSIMPILEMMPRKVRQLVSDLERAGSVNRGGKGSDRNLEHSKGLRVTISGKLGDDAQHYQEKQVRNAIDDSRT